MTTTAREAVLDTVLVANRGEIALRIARTCREMGIRVAVAYSTADRDSAAVRFADAAVCVGPAAARGSYLNPAALIEAARQVGAAAIHPGYGFLSEDSDFADACERSGLTFIGSPAAVMEVLWDKSRTRDAVARAGVPVLPGTGGLASAGEAAAAAAEIGYPVMLKAIAGGGGRGLQVVRDRRALPAAYDRTRAAARSVLPEGRLYLERFVERPRHVEVQVLADRHGTVTTLGQRDCSVQRRNQKLLEEAPAPTIGPRTGQAIGGAATDVAAALGVVGAATVEFLVDERGSPYFIEVNGRIQVEHPVTEMVTGIDIVREQIRIAAGLPVSRPLPAAHGAAIECRINAEDPARGFVPTPGRLDEVELPGGPFVRVDTHIAAGAAVPAEYDSLAAKIVVWAPHRDQAIARMNRALDELRIAGPGVHTTAGFLRQVLAHPLFRAAEHTTSLVADMLDDQPPR